MHAPIHPDPAQLNEYVDGALDDAAADQIAAHLAACSLCRDRVTALQGLCAGLAALPDEPLAVDLAPAVLARLPRPARGRVRAPGWLPRLVLAAQALAAAALFVLLWPWLAAAVPQSAIAHAWAGAAVMLNASASELAAALQPLLSRIAGLAPANWVAVPEWPAVPGPAAGWGIALAGFVLAWLLGNGVLLRRILRHLDRESKP